MSSGHGFGKVASGLFYGVWTLGYSNYNVTLNMFYGEEPVVVNGSSTSGLVTCGPM